MAAGAFAILAAFAVFRRPEGAWPLVVLAVVSALAANIDKISGLRASGAGFDLEWTRRAEAAVAEMNDVAGRLGNLETSTQNLMTELDAKTKDLAGQITGGESYPLVRGRARSKWDACNDRRVQGQVLAARAEVKLVDALVADPRAATGYLAGASFIATGFRTLTSSSPATQAI
jgi:hypothetical protein